MLNLINDTKQINSLIFRSINLHNYIKELVKFIKNNHIIKSLSFIISGINDEDLKLLCEAIKENDTINSLYLNGNDKFHNIEPICDLIQNNKNITILHFNSVFECSFKPLIETLKTNNSVKEIYITDTYKLFDDFCDMLLINKSLTNISFYASYTLNLAKIKDVLQNNKNITHLTLANNLSDDWTPLIEGLKLNNTLKYFNVNNTNITDYKPFYEIIKTNMSLTHIYINHENKKDDNGKMLIDALQNNKTIQILDADGIIINDVLKYFRIIYNRIYC